MSGRTSRTIAAPAGASRPPILSHSVGQRAPLWRLERVLQEVPLSRSTIRRMELAGTFPKRVRLSGNSVAWRSDQVEAWMAARPEIDST